MEPRMKNPVLVLPDAMKAFQAAGNTARTAGVPDATLDLIHLRVSQINGCALCLSLDVPKVTKSGDDGIERALLVAGWREAPCFDKAEQAALGLAEAVTRLADDPGVVSDEIWAEAAAHYDEKQLAALLIHIATINVWNRVNVSTRQPAGAFKL
jgi:alkylhydroperoxidase family enzyme